MKNNKIQKAQFDKVLKKMWNTLSNATQVAQIAEAPSVMTASGWRVDGNGKAVQDQQNSPAVKQLRDNLATIGEAATIAPTGVKDIELAYQAVRHPVQTARAVKSAATQAAKATQQLVSNGKNAVQRFKERRNFKSELDWSPESWFGTRQGYGYDAEDIASLQKHIPEYLEIEQKTKANGTWLKMPDGSTWEGDPRSWVQLMSKDGLKLAMERNFGATSWANQHNNSSYPIYNGESWLQNTEEFAKWWSGNHPFWNRVKNKGKYWEIKYPKNSKIFYVDAKGADYNHVPNPFSKKGTSWTDRLAFNAYNHGYDITKIDNVLEGSGKVVNDVVIHSDVPRKSLLGNNGNFDFSDKNIYKMLIPTIIGGYSTLNN